MEPYQQNNPQKEKEAMQKIGAFEKLKYIDPETVGEMHRIYKKYKIKDDKDDEVNRGGTWIRLYPEDLKKILSIEGFTSVKFIAVANTKKKTPDQKKFQPTIIVQLQISIGNAAKPEYTYVHYSPNSDEDSCPLPDPCNLYDSIE